MVLNPRLWILAGGLGLCVVSVLSLHEWKAERHQASATQQADASHQSLESHAAKADVFEAQAQNQKIQAFKEDPEILRLRARVAVLTEALNQRVPVDPNRGGGAPVPVDPPIADVEALSREQALLIAAQDRKAEAQEARIVALEGADAERKSEADDARQESSHLRDALASASRHPKWGVGYVQGATAWGDQARGLFLDRDFYALRTGVEITRNAYADTRQGWEIRLRAGITF